MEAFCMQVDNCRNMNIGRANYASTAYLACGEDNLFTLVEYRS